VTDGYLMDAKCQHDMVWWECHRCMSEIDRLMAEEQEKEENDGD
jgi:hypothetical protein